MPIVGRALTLAVCLLAAGGLHATTTPDAQAQLQATLVASGLSRPLGLVQHPTDTDALIVLEQRGRVRVLKGGTVLSADFLTLTDQVATGGEQGVLGLAFAVNYTVTRRVFVSFTNRQGHSVVARYQTTAADPLRADPATRFDLVWPGGQRFITQPYANHNGGHLAFGPDGYLYFGLGDGGSADDPFNHAQNPASLLGKMLRLDVNVPDADPEGYDVPATNPFVGRSDVRPEIWALGLRNPWRWSFDDERRGGTGALVIADVGQDEWEEVNYQPKGAGGLNYGWRTREGAHANVTTPGPFSTPLDEPLWEYARSQGRSITGGFVYRGRALGTPFVGRYFVADYIANRVWSLELAIDRVTGRASVRSAFEHTADLGGAATAPASFGVDAGGELYLVSLNGAIYRLDAPPGTTPAPDPTLPSIGEDGPRRRGGDPKGEARPR